jgi:hypothetical protein
MLTYFYDAQLAAIEGDGDQLAELCASVSCRRIKSNASSFADSPSTIDIY